ncbi:MAG: sigma-70 family RNA polymerase sigma factor [Myxococcota bacterium]
MVAEINDEQLAAAWQTGDARAGMALMGRYMRSIDRYFYTRLGAHEVEDLRQEVLTRVSASITGYRHQASFRTYLYRIAHRTLCDHLRYQSSGRGRRDMATCMLEEFHLVVDPADRALPDLIAALRSLDAEERALFELRHIEGLSYEEIAAVTGADCATATLRARVHEIMKRLRRKLTYPDDAASQR